MLRIVRVILSFVVVVGLVTGCGTEDSPTTVGNDRVGGEEIASDDAGEQEVGENGVAATSTTAVPSTTVVVTTSAALPGNGTVLDPAANDDPACRGLVDFLLDPVVWAADAEESVAMAALDDALAPLGGEATELLTELIAASDAQDDVRGVAIFAEMEELTLDRCRWPFVSGISAVSTSSVVRFCEVSAEIGIEEPDPAPDADDCETPVSTHPDSLPCFAPTGLPFSFESDSYVAVDCVTHEEVVWDSETGEWGPFSYRYVPIDDAIG